MHTVSALYVHCQYSEELLIRVFNTLLFLKGHECCLCTTYVLQIFRTLDYCGFYAVLVLKSTQVLHMHCICTVCALPIFQRFCLMIHHDG